MKTKFFIAAMMLSVLAFSAHSQEVAATATLTSPRASKHEVILEQMLDQKGFDKKSVQMMIVDFPPLSVSPAHRHPCPTFGYVISGEIVSVFEGKEHHYKAGDSFYEVPNGLHNSTRNDSQDTPAKLLAFFIKDNDGKTIIPEKHK